MPTFLYYDTETTGLKSDKDRIFELAAFDPVQNRTFCELIHPGVPLSAETTALCGVTDAMLEGKPNFTEVGKAFIEFCGPDAILIAHNNERFDKLFLEAEFARCGLTLPSWRYLDTLKWSRKYRPDLPSHALQNLREVYGIPANQAHRALDDVIVLHQIFSTMIDDLSIEMVLKLLEDNPDSQRMPFGKFQGRLLTEVPVSYVKWLSESGALSKPENKSLKEAFIKHKMITP
ncbi:MAG: DUF3820 family protein [Verrucomicrobia bacterium]|nr:DUF3820 family protein [Verrucomicrobiota bacterium]